MAVHVTKIQDVCSARARSSRSTQKTSDCSNRLVRPVRSPTRFLRQPCTSCTQGFRAASGPGISIRGQKGRRTVSSTTKHPDDNGPHGKKKNCLTLHADYGSHSETCYQANQSRRALAPCRCRIGPRLDPLNQAQQKPTVPQQRTGHAILRLPHRCLPTSRSVHRAPNPTRCRSPQGRW